MCKVGCEDRPEVGSRKEVEHEGVAGLARVQHMTGAGALKGPEPGVLQALVGCQWHCLACSLTQLLLIRVNSS